MVLLQQIHDGVEVAHVLPDHESEVTRVYLLVVDNIVSDLVAGPLSIRGVRQDILNAREHCHWDGADVLKRDQICLSLATNDVIEVIRIDLEPVLFHVLGVVQDRLHARAVRLVAHIDSEPVIVVKFRVLIHEQLGDKLAEGGDIRAEKLGDATCEPVGAE